MRGGGERRYKTGGGGQEEGTDERRHADLQVRVSGIDKGEDEGRDG